MQGSDVVAGRSGGAAPGERREQAEAGANAAPGQDRAGREAAGGQAAGHDHGRAGQGDRDGGEQRGDLRQVEKPAGAPLVALGAGGVVAQRPVQPVEQAAGPAEPLEVDDPGQQVGQPGHQRLLGPGPCLGGAAQAARGVQGGQREGHEGGQGDDDQGAADEPDEGQEDHRERRVEERQPGGGRAEVAGLRHRAEGIAPGA